MTVVREFINLVSWSPDEASFKAAESKVDKMIDKMESFGNKATLFITTPFLALSTGIGKVLSDFEQLDVAFSTMLGSAEKADVLLEDLFQLAAKTPFGVMEITDTSKQLLAMGIDSEKLIDTLIDLGNVSAGLSVPISRLALNFGQVRTRGKLAGQELKDFAVAGVPLTAELAKQLGVAEKEVADLVSKGKVGFPEVEKAFRSMARGNGKFADLMIKQSKTLGGLWSNFLDLIVLSARSMESFLLPAFKTLVTFLISLVDKFEKMSSTLKAVLFVMGGLFAIVGPLTIAFTVMVKVGLGVQKTLLAVALAARTANISLGLLLAKFALIGAAIFAALAAIALLAEDLILFTKGQESFIGRFLEPWETLGPKVLKALEPFLNGVKKFWENVKSTFNSIIDFIRFVFADNVELAAGEVENIILKFIDNMILIITFMFKALTTIGKIFWNVVISNMPRILAFLGKIIFRAISAIIQGVFSLVSEAFAKLQNKAIDFFKNFGKAARNFISGGLDSNLTANIAGIGATGTSTAAGALSQGLTNSKTTTVQNNNTFTIPQTITVPEGTPAEQAQAIGSTVRGLVKDAFQTEVNNLAVLSGALQ